METDKKFIAESFEGEQVEITPQTDLVEGYVLNIDKPLEWTSTDVVRRVKVLLRRSGYSRNIKVGHAGTLDPLATGVLLVCVGRATKRVNELQEQEKEYIADVMLGATTPSYDLEHPIDKTYPYEHITREQIESALEELSGERVQIPPIYSAKRIDGQRAYDYARSGKEVEMRGARINIYEMELLSFELPLVRVRVRCSKGTYIRALAREIGEAVGSGGHLVGLRRSRSGEFIAENGYSIEQIGERFEEFIEAFKSKQIQQAE